MKVKLVIVICWTRRLPGRHRRVAVRPSRLRSRVRREQAGRASAAPSRRMEWTNPHVWIHMDVKIPDGKSRTGRSRLGRRTCSSGGVHRRLADAGDGHQGRRLPGKGRHTACERPRPDLFGRKEAVHGIVGHGRALRVARPGVDTEAPEITRPFGGITSDHLARVCRRDARSPAASLHCLDDCRLARARSAVPSTALVVSRNGSAVLLAWNGVLLVSALRQRRRFTLAIALRQQHYVQACAHTSILRLLGLVLAAGLRIRPYLIVAQLLFAYAFDALLTWSRRRHRDARVRSVPDRLQHEPVSVVQAGLVLSCSS